MILTQKELSRKLHTKYEYFEVRDSSWIFLLDNNITSYPLNIRKIIDKNEYKLISYKKYCESKIFDREKLEKTFPKGFTIQKDNKYLIVINENLNIQDQSFNICHEIGHIKLHKTIKDFDQLEFEADMFANRILMPIVLIHELKPTSEELAKLCNVELFKAEKRIERYNKIKSRNKFYTSNLERELLKQLTPFIDTIKNNPKH